MPQFSDAEIRVAVEETAARGVYVMAHCHTDDGAARCAALGIRSVEHGTLIERNETARALAAAGTLCRPDAIRRRGAQRPGRKSNAVGVHGREESSDGRPGVARDRGL